MAKKRESVPKRKRLDNIMTNIDAAEINGLIVCGVDEVGRGPLAGPVVAAAVAFRGYPQIDGLADSKLLNFSTRLKLAPTIVNQAVSVAIVSLENAAIDKINILNATLMAMRKAVTRLEVVPDIVLVDGQYEIPELTLCQKAIIHGDRFIPHISAASIVAKVARDILMIQIADQYPEYKFDKHKGYPTPEHLAILEKLGPCPIHRRSFRPISIIGRVPNAKHIR